MNEQPEISTAMPISSASVKVMRSHDYCHFEVCLSASLLPDVEPSAQVDELRKTAARLADKAVGQYQAAKLNAENILRHSSNVESLKYRHRDILEKPEESRSPEEKAIVKAISDRAFVNRPRYNYEDDWEEQGCDDDSEIIY